MLLKFLALINYKQRFTDRAYKKMMSEECTSAQTFIYQQKNDKHSRKYWTNILKYLMANYDVILMRR